MNNAEPIGIVVMYCKVLAPKRQRWEGEWFDEDECLLKLELTTHTAKPVTMANTTWWNYKQKQSKTKHKLKQQTHKYHTGVTNEFSINL